MRQNKNKQDSSVIKEMRKIAKDLEKNLDKRLEVELKKIQTLATTSHHLSIKTNNSLQDVKQELILFKEENHREHVAMKKDSEREHAELRKLLLAGDKGSAELMVEESGDREEAVNNLDQRVGILEKDFGLMRQRFSNTI